MSFHTVEIVNTIETRSKGYEKVKRYFLKSTRYNERRKLKCREVRIIRDGVTRFKGHWIDP